MSFKKSLTVYPITRIFLLRAVRIFVKKSVGIENIPSSGPYIIACKHLGPLDGIFIAAVIIPKLNRKIHFIANIAPWGWVWKKVIAENWAGCIPFNKEDPRACLDTALDYLYKKEIVGIFPEGIVHEYNPKVRRARTGVARLAIQAKVPILPVGLVHNITIRRNLPRLYQKRHVFKNILLNPRSMEIHIGQPFELDMFYNQEITKELLVKAINRVMDKVDALTDIKWNNHSYK